jgi:integrase
LRDGEQRALQWPNVDLEHGTVNVCEVFDRHAGASREGTKTGASRTVPILPELVPLLRELAAKAEGEGLVCRGVTEQTSMARGLRTWLREGGGDLRRSPKRTHLCSPKVTHQKRLETK